jgi:hypothetical protein
VVVDGNVITSRGPGTAIEFSLAMVEMLYGEAKAKEVAAPMVRRSSHHPIHSMACAVRVERFRCESCGTLHSVRVLATSLRVKVSGACRGSAQPVKCPGGARHSQQGACAPADPSASSEPALS